VGVWALAARPKTLPAAAAPVVLGSACAFAVGSFRLGPALAALVGALLIQIATNLANDVADFERGTDTEARVGPLRVTQAGLLTPRQVTLGVLAAFALAALAGAYLIAVAGWPVAAIGVASILAGLAYSSGPFPLSHHGLGEPFVMAFFGFAAVAGTAYVQALAVPASAWWGGLVAGALTTAILVVNNTRDHATDRAAGRRTIPARLGRRAGVAEFAAFLVLGHAGTLAMVATGAAPVWSLAALLTAPLAWRLWRTLAVREDGPTGNRVLARTGGVLLLHCLLLSAGLVAGRAAAP
jgi:1,4-dihydroxy-2-naphthoate octaprenyltransferase